MNKKKAIKLVTASALAASSFAAVAPFNSEAAVNVAGSVKAATDSASKAYHAYYDVAFKGQAASVASVQSMVKSAQTSYQSAKKIVNSYKGKDKSAYLAKLAAASKNITLAQNYITAVNYATGLKNTATKLDTATRNNGFKAVKSIFTTFTSDLNKAEKTIRGLVSGKTAADVVVKSYLTYPRNVLSLVSAYSYADNATDLIAKGDLANAKVSLDNAAASLNKGPVASNLGKAVSAYIEKVKADYTAKLAPMVVSVSAINAKEVVVTFNKPVDEATVIASGNLKTGVFKLNNAEANLLTSSASLSKDGKTLTLVANTAWSGSYSFELLANQAKSVDSKDVSEFKSFFTANDTTRAEVTGVTYVDKYTYDVQFSEPVNSTGTLAYAYTDGTATAITATPTPSTDKKSVRLAFNPATLANKEITVSLPSITDFAGNVSKPATAKVTISDADKTKPVVSSITTTGYNGTNTSFQIKLSEPVSGTTVSGITVNGASVTATVDANDKTLVNATIVGKTKGSLLVYIPAGAVTDLNGNVNAEVGQFYTFTQDEAAPTIVSQSVERINGVQTLILTYNEDINTVNAPGTLAFTSVDQYGMPATTTLTTPATARYNVVDGKTKQVSVSLAGLADNKSYKVTLAAGLAKDYYNNTSAEAKDVAVSTSSVDTGVGTTNVASIGLTPATPGQVVVSFTKPVNIASAQTVSNYAVEDATVTKAEVTANGAGGATVVLTLADGSVETTGHYNVTVKPITSFNSLDKTNAVTTASVTLKENVKPVLSSKVLTNLSADALDVKLTFSDATVTNGSGLDFALYVNGVDTGKKIDVADLAPAVAGSFVASWSEALPTNDVADLTTATSIKLVPLATLDIADSNGNIVKASDIVIK